jgi:hypothetical protein
MSKHRKHLTKHHLLARCRRGKSQEWNLLQLWNDRHEIWHTLFGVRNLREIIQLLERVEQAKNSQKRRK